MSAKWLNSNRNSLLILDELPSDGHTPAMATAFALTDLNRWTQQQSNSTWYKHLSNNSLSWALDNRKTRCPICRHQDLKWNLLGLSEALRDQKAHQNNNHHNGSGIGEKKGDVNATITDRSFNVMVTLWHKVSLSLSLSPCLLSYLTQGLFPGMCLSFLGSDVWEMFVWR